MTKRKRVDHGNFIIAVFVIMKTGGARFANKNLNVAFIEMLKKKP